jgi:hypothetical protein
MEVNSMETSKRGMQCYQNGPDKAGNDWEQKLITDSRTDIWKMI